MGPRRQPFFCSRMFWGEVAMVPRRQTLLFKEFLVEDGAKKTAVFQERNPSLWILYFVAPQLGLSLERRAAIPPGVPPQRRCYAPKSGSKEGEGDRKSDL